MLVTKVIATVRRAGFHCWPGAPQSASHLLARHRHLFTFRVEVQVEHDDRDTEFHELMGDILGALGCFGLGDHGIEFRARSCEMIAVELANHTARQDILAVEVWEDDEHGARVEWT